MLKACKIVDCVPRSHFGVFEKQNSKQQMGGGGRGGGQETRSGKLRSRGPRLRPTQALRMPKFLVQIQDGGIVSF